MWCYYDPTTGTFTTRDPLDGVDGTTTVANAYHYVNNDPVNLIDPMGLRPCDANFKAFNKFAHNAVDTTGDLDQLDRYLRDTQGVSCLESVTTDGHGRAVLRIGDENAPNVLIMPATAGQDLKDGFINTVRTVNAIRQAAGKALTVVAYLGYDPGGPLSQLQPNEAGGLAQQFTWYSSRNQHVTGLGYSYGAQAVAQAFTSGGAKADDVILLGPWMRGNVSFAGAKRVWLGINANDTETTVGLTSSVASNMRKMSTAGTSKHWYLSQVPDQNGNPSFQPGNEATTNIVSIALGKYQNVLCDAADPNCDRP